MPGNEPVQSLSRGLDIIIAVSESGDGLRLNEISEALGLKQSTAHNLVKTLKMKGFVEKCEDGRLRLGGVLGRLSGNDGASKLHAVMAKAMLALSAKLPMAVLTFSVAQGADVSVVLRVSGDAPGLVQRPQSMNFHLYYNVSALACLAFAEQEKLSWLRLNHPFMEEGAKHWKDVKALEGYLEDTRRQGYAASPFDESGELRAAAPLRSSSGLFLGCIGLSIQPGVVKGEDAKSAVASLLEACKGIQGSLQGIAGAI